MNLRAPIDAEVIRRGRFDATEVRALRALRRGKVQHLLEIDAGRLARLLAQDDDRELYRCTQFDTEAELLQAFDRVSLAYSS